MSQTKFAPFQNKPKTPQ